MLGGLSVAVLPASAGQSGPPTAPLAPNISNPIYLPFITNKIFDLYISNIEVTQAVQNISVPVNLVAGRQTEARVYARTGGDTQVNNLQASLTVYKNGIQLGKLTAGPGSAYLQSESLDTLRASMAKSFNFAIPTSWLGAGDITFTADIDTNNAVPELSEENTTTLQYHFNAVPALNVMAVPVHYIDTGNNGPGDYPPPNTSFLQEALLRMYPVPAVNVTVHAAPIFSGDLSGNDSDWDYLLDLIDSNQAI